MYHYAGNNPVKYTDPTGEFAIAVPLIPAAVEGVKDLALLCLAVLCGVGIGEGVEALSQSIENEQTKNFVYHMTGASGFAKALKKEGVSVIDPNIGPGTSRFGNKFYVAGDKVTSLMEASNPGIMLRFKMSESANILDLTNKEISESLGYQMGLSHDETQELMKDWDLTGIDAIKYPSERNPGGINYAIINPSILRFEGVEGL